VARLRLGSVRARLSAMLLVASIPILAVALTSAFGTFRAAQSEARERVLLQREALVTRLSMLVDGAGQVLDALSIAGTGDLPAPRCARIAASLISLHRGRYSMLGIANGAGRVVCSSNSAGDGADVSNTRWFRDAWSHPGMMLAGFDTDASREPTAIIVAGRVGEQVFFIAVETRDLIGVEAAGKVGVHSPAWLLDRIGVTLPLAGAAAAELPPPAVLAELFTAARGEARQGNAGAGRLYTAAIINPGLRVVMALPDELWRADAEAAFLRRAAELLALLLGSLAAVLVGLNIAVVQPVRLVTGRIRDWAPDSGAFRTDDLAGAPSELRTMADAFAENCAALADQQRRLQAALTERDLLLSEIHHRIKNNLQTVGSLLRLQADRLQSSEARNALASASSRVRAMSTLHRHMYAEPGAERLEVQPFLEDLVQEILSTFDDTQTLRIDVRVAASGIQLEPDRAVPLSLLVTEWISLLLRDAPAGGQQAGIGIRLVAADGRIDLGIDDTGIRPPGTAWPVETEGEAGLGLVIIRALAAQLGGEIRIEPAGSPRPGLTLRLPG
jgi:two-component sensor histidine kinase